jgi:hypothetical protein
LRLSATGVRNSPYHPCNECEASTIVGAHSRARDDGATCIKYAKVIKKRIVDLQWQRWDLKAENVPETPQTGEPEDYIVGRPVRNLADRATNNPWSMVGTRTRIKIRKKIVSKIQTRLSRDRSYGPTLIVAGPVPRRFARRWYPTF